MSGFPAATPESVGLDPAPFQTLKSITKRNVRSLGALPGCAHLVLKDGKCVFAHADGLSNIEKKTKFNLRTLCPLHGASKPLVAAAFLTLLDEGRVKLSDTIDKYIPFTSRVVVGKDANSTRNIKTQPTLRHLLTMTAGVGYDDFVGYRSAMRKATNENFDLAALCEHIANSPLQFEPGSRYHYSFSADVIGYICERISGMKVDKFVRERLLLPLGMKDTYFEQTIPVTKQRRMTVMYSTVKRTSGSKRKGAPETGWESEPARFSSRAPGILSCGGGVVSYRDYGMVSTVRDYARFCQMLLRGGLAPGSNRRILQESTVHALWKDGTTPFQRQDGRLPGWNDADGPAQGGNNYWDGVGWSLLNTHLVFKDPPRRTARKGSSMWMGGGGGAFWNVDADRGMVAITFAPVFGGRSDENDGFGPLASDATEWARAAHDQGKEYNKKSVKRNRQTTAQGSSTSKRRRG